VALKDDTVIFGGIVSSIDMDLFAIPQATVYRKRFNVNPFLEKALIEINHRSERL
jgi:hypothetical protein